jgi:hypothetical protein
MSVERLACPQCGSNNFATQARCWSCGTALAPESTPASPLPRPTAPSAPAQRALTGLSFGAAIAFGLLFPALAIPVGIVFLMLDDRQKAQIGWQNILWGTIGTVLHIFATMALSAAITPMLLQAMTRAVDQARGAGESGLGGLPPGFPGTR